MHRHAHRHTQAEGPYKIFAQRMQRHLPIGISQVLNIGVPISVVFRLCGPVTRSVEQIDSSPPDWEQWSFSCTKSYQSNLSSLVLSKPTNATNQCFTFSIMSTAKNNCQSSSLTNSGSAKVHVGLHVVLKSQDGINLKTNEVQTTLI